MTKVYLWAYKPGSKSATKLAKVLEIKKIKHSNSVFKGDSNKTIINWGSTQPTPEVFKCRILNHPSKIEIVSNKLKFFESISHENFVNLVPWTTEIGQVRDWLDGGFSVFGRSLLTSHSGNGIMIYNPGESSSLDDVPSLSLPPLFTKYIKKDSEWRIHCMKFNEDIRIIFEQRKVRDPNKEPTNWKIRSHKNGFIFQHNNLNVPNLVREQAIAAFKASGLDFGGVDVIFNKHEQKAYILEINSAVGLEGQTVEVYANAFKELLG
jgi:hypothetical protein